MRAKLINTVKLVREFVSSEVFVLYLLIVIACESLLLLFSAVLISIAYFNVY